MSYKLRPYQLQLIDECRKAFKQGHREVIGMLPTGAGKSIVIKSIIEQSKVKDILFVVHRKILIIQMRDVLKGLNVEIETLQKIGKNPTKEYGLIIHDECHYSWNSKLKGNLRFKFYLGLSATPLDANGYPLQCDKLISFLQMPDLIELGYAVPFKVLSTSKVDTSKLKKSSGNYNIKESYNLMSKSEIKKDILKTYRDYCDGLKTIIYAVNIQHGEELHKQFLEDGIKNELIHSKKKTEQIINDFKNNKIKVLINVSILTIGFDDGDVEALLLATPIKSQILAQQIYGRVSRLPIKSNKKYGLIVDCSNAVSDSIHPMARVDFNRTKQTKKVKTCCETPMQIFKKEVIQVDELSYKTLNHYRCSVCNNSEVIEKYSIANLNLCEYCSTQLTGGNIEMIQTDKSLNFVIECHKCKHKNVQKNIVLTDAELKILEHQEALQGEDTWEKVRIILVQECKKWDYHHRYSVRLIESLQNRKKTPTEALEMIKKLQDSGDKIGKLNYI